MTRLALPLVLAVSTTAALADEGHHYIRTRWVEAEVSVERPGGEVEQASLNVPVLPGDRLVSEVGGRAELQTADGTLIRLDERSQLDYLDQQRDDGGAELFVLRLRSGSLYIHGTLPPNRYRIDTTHGSIEVTSPGLLRVDTDRYETRLSVLEGEAVLLGEGEEMLVASWQTASAIRGRQPARPRTLDVPNDAFAAWEAERGAPDAGWSAQAPGLGWQELSAEGEWLWDEALGQQVWRPSVDREWQPFVYGRWYWAEDDWVWVADEPWGWAPYHYGRWRQSSALGWYWVPGSGWAPSWVDWIEGDDYVGWRPEGLDASPDVDVNIWVFTQRVDFGRHDIHRCRLRMRPREYSRARRVRTARLGHDLHLTFAVRRTAIHPHVSPAPSPSSAERRAPRPRPAPLPSTEGEPRTKAQAQQPPADRKWRETEAERRRSEIQVEERASKQREEQREGEQLLRQREEQRRREDERLLQLRAEREQREAEARRTRDQAEREQERVESQRRQNEQQRKEEVQRQQQRVESERRQSEVRETQQRAERERADERRRALQQGESERRQNEAQRRSESERRTESQRAQERVESERRQNEAQRRVESERRSNEQREVQRRSNAEREARERTEREKREKQSRDQQQAEQARRKSEQKAE